MKNIIISATLLLIMATAVSCKSKTGEAGTEHEVLAPNAIEMNAAQYKSAGIQVSTPGERSIRGVLKVNGLINVTPQNIASVSAPLGGFVKSTTPVQGSQVTKGEVLAMVENMAFIELEQAYLETKARYAYAEIEFNRHNELYKENVYSENNVQLTESEYKTLKSQMRGLEQKLLMLGIDPKNLTEDKISGVVPVLAPISGYITSANVNIGKYVNPTDVMFEIVDPRNIILELTLFEKDVQKVEDGQGVTFTTPDEPRRKYTATIYQAGKALDKDKTSRAYARIKDPGTRLLSGMYVNAEIETTNRPVIAVPEEAVVQFNGTNYIFVYKGKRMENGKEISDFEAVEVKRGATDSGFTEITLPENYPAAGLQVVTKGAYSVLSAWKNAGEMAC